MLFRSQLAHSARADLLRRLGQRDAALAAYSIALSLTSQAAQRRYLERRIAEVQEVSTNSERMENGIPPE